MRTRLAKNAGFGFSLQATGRSRLANSTFREPSHHTQHIFGFDLSLHKVHTTCCNALSLVRRHLLRGLRLVDGCQPQRQPQQDVGSYFHAQLLGERDL